MDRSCTSCKSSETKTKHINRTSWISAFLVIILPKCPFCVMAYTSAITMCGGTDMYFTDNNWVSYIPLILSVIILIMIGLNRRGIRTVMAMGVALVGTSMIFLTHQLILSPDFYMFGTMLLISAIWMNSSLMAFIGQIERVIMNKLNTWPR